MAIRQANSGLLVWDQAAREADWTLELPGGVPMFFRRIPAGSFRMGSRGYDAREEPSHRVVIPEDFYLGSFVVTQEQYRAVAERSPALEKEYDPSSFKGLRRPVENVSWRDAMAFCDGLGRETARDLPEGFGLASLPTEAEWEYACRAGTDMEYYSGDGERALAEVAWYTENSGRETHPVDERVEGHSYGLYGMHGNVWEWCHDAWDRAAYRKRADGEADSGGPRRRAEGQAGLPAMTESDRYRVMRGGSWCDDPWLCRSAYRRWIGPGERFRLNGFRVCLVCGLAEPGESGAEPSGAPEDAGRGTRPEAPRERTRSVSPGFLDVRAATASG